MIAEQRILKLEANEIFVFGSNLAGRHGLGAALHAVQRFGAQHGVGRGRTGRCYAIPTKDHNLKVLPLDEIGRHVTVFAAFADNHPELRFLVTAIGCGLAGYKPAQIAPLFSGCMAMKNVVLPAPFVEVLTTNRPRTQVARFLIQPTVSFPEGAPQREEYDDGAAGERAFDFACLDYAAEWVKQYECCDAHCINRDCPQHGPALVAATRKKPTPPPGYSAEELDRDNPYLQ